MDKNYLDSDFDASKLTVLQLKQILTAHEIFPPSQTKKADLVKIFDEQIKANSENIKNKLEEVKADEASIESANNDDRTMNLRSRSNSSRRSSVQIRGQSQRERSMTPSGYSDDEEEKHKISSPLRNTRTSVIEPSSALKTPIITKKSSTRSRSSSQRERSMTPSGYSDDEEVKPKISSPLRNTRTTILDPSSALKTPIIIKKDAEGVDSKNPLKPIKTFPSTSTGKKSLTPTKSSGSKSKASSAKSDTKTSKANGHSSTPSKFTNGETQNSVDEEVESESESESYEVESTPVRSASNQTQLNTIQKSAQSNVNGNSASSIYTSSSRRSVRLQNSSSKKSQGTPSHASNATPSTSKSKTILNPTDESAPKIPSPLRDPLPHQQENFTYNQEVMYQFRHRQDWGILKTIFYYTFIALLIAYLVLYRFEKVKLGYSNTIEPIEESSPLDFLRPLPMPCPDNAICEDRQVKGCKHGFRYRDHPLSNRIWPFFSPVCIPKIPRSKVINVVTDEIIKYSSDHRAKVMCHRTRDSPDISIEALYTYLTERSQFRTELKNSPTLFNDTIKNIANRHKQLVTFYNRQNDIIRFDKIDFDINSIESIISNKPNYNLACKISISLMDLAYRYRVNLSKLLIAFVFGAWLYFWNQNRMRVNSRVNALTGQVIKTLKRVSQSQTPPRPGSVNPVALSIYQTRDILLSNEFPSIQIRQQIWKKVVRNVEKNSNVRSRIIECRGESQEVWEWIGIATEEDSVTPTPGSPSLSSPSVNAANTSQQAFDTSLLEASFVEVEDENLYPNLEELLN